MSKRETRETEMTPSQAAAKARITARRNAYRAAVAAADAHYRRGIDRMEQHGEDVITAMSRAAGN